MISKAKTIGLLAVLPLLLTVAIMTSNTDDIYAVESKGTSLPQTGSANSPVCGDRLCSEVDVESLGDKEMQDSDSPQYIYKQDFLPLKKMDIDLETTAIFITDPQNDFLSEGGAAWPLVGEGVIEVNVVQHQAELIATAKEVGIPVFYSPHTYTEMDYANWKHLNSIDQLMFDIDMFHEGTWGHEFHSKLIPDENTIVMNPHKGLSNFQTGDANLQLRQYGIQTVIMTGMSANLCVESHLRDATENGFEVIVIEDATAGAGPFSKDAALTNFEFISSEVTTTNDIIERLKQAASTNNS